MTDDTASASAQPSNDAAGRRDEELGRLGITIHQHLSYEWNGFRYSNRTDAIAAAKRAAK